MMKKRWRATAVGLVSATAMLSAMLANAGPASASTDGNQSAKAAAGPPTFGSDICEENEASTTCFEPYGDKIWVYDAKADGKAAAGYWQNYLEDSAGNWHLYRDGQCVNHLSEGHWGYCNYDFYEDTSHNAEGGYGSGVRVYPCIENGVIGDYVWVRNNH